MRFILLLATVTTAAAGGTGAGSYSGSFAEGDGQGYGYGGSFGPSGSSPPQAVPFDFNNLFKQYFDIFNRFNQELTAAKISAYSYSVTNANSGARVQAQSSITFGKPGLQNHQNAIANNVIYASGYPVHGGGVDGSFGNFNGLEGASASASVGPGGVQQTAAVYPENPNIPNVNTRFGENSPGGSSYGVFTSSQSFSSNVNGKPNSYHRASTTINDNGKITTYSVHNP